MILPRGEPPLDIASPCVDVCRMNERTGLCEGCLRTIDEIAAWSALDREGKVEVLRAIDLRRQRAGGAKLANAAASGGASADENAT